MVKILLYFKAHPWGGDNKIFNLYDMPYEEFSLFKLARKVAFSYDLTFLISLQKHIICSMAKNREVKWKQERGDFLNTDP